MPTTTGLSRCNRPGILALALLLTVLASTPARAAEPTPLPGIVRSTNSIYLMEDHSAAFIVWKAKKIQGATLIHVDTHDDCRFIAPEKLGRLNTLAEVRRFEEISSLSHIDSSFGFRIRPADFLYDLGNFIYPALLDGTVSNFWWIVPGETLSGEIHSNLVRHLSNALHVKVPLPSLDQTITFQVSNATVHVSTLAGLPAMPPGTLLDIDADFFVFDFPLSETHLRNRLSADPETTCDTLARQVPSPAVVTISSSVWGGYLPLIFRFLPDAIFDRFASGAYPADARHIGAAVNLMRSGPETVPQSESDPKDETYRPAVNHLNALLALMQGDSPAADRLLQEAAEKSPVYAKAFLDASEAGLFTKDALAAHRMVDRFEALKGGSTVPSTIQRCRIHLFQNQPDKAAPFARRLMEWEKQPNHLLLQGGVFLQQGRIDDAAAIYQEVIRTASIEPAGYFNMGLLWERRGETDKAILLYQAAVNRRPDFADAQENLGYLLMLKGDLNAATNHLSIALNSSPLRVTALTNLGMTLIRKGVPASAIPWLERAATLAPSLAEVQADLGLAYERAGIPGKAIERFRKALALRPGWAEVETSLRNLEASRLPK